MNQHLVTIKVNGTCTGEDCALIQLHQLRNLIIGPMKASNKCKSEFAAIREPFVAVIKAWKRQHSKAQLHMKAGCSFDLLVSKSVF